MDSFSIQSPATVVLRPSAVDGADLDHVLARGRVVAGEVLQTFGGGSILIGIGRHRVPAQSEVEMQPGEHYLFQVERRGDQIALRVVTEPEANAEPALVRALRSALGNALPVGDALQDLARAVESGPDAASGPARELLQALRAHVFTPGGSGQQLLDFLRSSGANYEAGLAHEVFEHSSSGELRETLERLESWIANAVSDGEASSELPRDPSALFAKLRDGLWKELAQSLGTGADAAREVLTPKLDWGSIARDLRAWLTRALQSLGDSPQISQALAKLRSLDFEGLSSDEKRLLARGLLGAALEGAAHEGSLDQRVAQLIGDLKSELLRAESRFSEGPTREAVSRALDGIEAEQVLNVARSEGGEPRHWNLAVLDGTRWTTLALVHRRVEDGDPRHGREEDRPAHRLTVAVEFSATGPVRADFLARTRSLAVRIAVARPEVAERLRSDQAELEARFAHEGRSVAVSIALVAPEEARLQPHLEQIRFLRDHHIMDLAG